ncbi:excalibur calcium-binding domain-containing protein [Phyllobacterium sp. YR531]|uniref:excalibur calcium-binding domain-containing protein n=1 Tax=Phyllobacterium sp. YR531 TaxID=1144343 RepID=UPI00026F5231|nr:excalibur calcium-binding domain-containing protein [Phyllobacterium sp. YR531]EJN05617.1 hypothetical protein PMI41_00823 [Phyllobacterium sp. YR531]
MRVSAFVSCLFAATFFGVAANTAPLFETGERPLQSPWLKLVARITCKQVSSCEEAVQIWCDGYGRADGDSDGIPCENVCSSKEEVDLIRQQIGC